jgi:ATP-binding protein involved in chromosome partitioning
MIDPRTDPEWVGPSDDGVRLVIRWRDGHRSEYLPRPLRLACRCAGCIEEMTGRPLLVPNLVPPDVYPIAIHYVGRYALRFEWSDGHDTGIYPYDHLRAICPCCQG